jgi:hypothetical protein
LLLLVRKDILVRFCNHATNPFPIAGASQGIGAALAELVAAEGAKKVILLVCYPHYFLETCISYADCQRK